MLCIPILHRELHNILGIQNQALAKKGRFMGQVWRHTPMINTGRLMQVPIKQLQTLWTTYHKNLPARKVIGQNQSVFAP